jgi:molecular chaperone GrpE
MADNPTDSRTPSDELAETPDAAALRAENASLQDRLLRALADAENVRRRADRAAQDARNFAVTDLSRELLTVVDNLRRAIATAEDPAVDSAGSAPLLQGIKAVERALMRTLERFGVRQVEARGTPFNPLRHEAIMEVDDPGQAPGSVADVLEEGYTIHDRLLRPAKVSVTRSRRAATPDESAPPGDRRGSSANRGE